MRNKIIKMLMHFLVHNGGELPAQIIVSPTWAEAVRLFLAELDLASIEVHGNVRLHDDDIELVGW